MKKFLFNLVFLVLIVDMLLFLSGYRVIFDEKIVQPGEHYVADQFGDLAGQKEPSLVCRYWDGLKRRTSVFGYGTKEGSYEKCPLYVQG